MNWVDGVMIGLVLASGLLGLLRGFVRELLGLVALAGAVIAAITLYPYVQGPMNQLLQDRRWADPLAYAVVFVAVLVVLSIIASAAGAAVRRSLLGGADRFLGGLFGLARGVAVLVIGYVVLSMATGPADWPPPVLQARLMPPLYRATVWTADRIPEEHRPRVEAPIAEADAAPAPRMSEPDLPSGVPMPHDDQAPTHPVLK